MKQLLLWVAAVLVLVASPARASDWEDGYAAYQVHDYIKAVKLWRRVAEEGDSAAQSLLGSMYAFGQGVPQNYAEALKWYRLAAAQGEPKAQFKLGYMYAYGQGVSKNMLEAFTWYRRAAKQGHVEAQYNVGLMYEAGQVIERNYVRALMWSTLAAEAGHRLAAKSRDLIASQVAPNVAAQALKMAHDCQDREFKACN